MNNQKPEPRVMGDGDTLDFHSMFYTLQGEGPFSGHRSIFVRLAGCNLRCPGCDTEYTAGRAFVNTFDLARRVHDLAVEHDAPNCLVVVTGGEPLRQRIGPFIRALIDNKHPVQIESNGVFEPDFVLGRMLGYKDITLVVSPKTSRISTGCLMKADCFKYVLDHMSVAPDGLPIKALDHPASTGVARPRPETPVYVNPFDSGDAEHNQKNLEAVAASCLAHGYIAGVQMHKLMNLA